MKHAINPRREIGIRTIFNVLGPLTNPASANAQLVGVYDPKLTTQLAKALERLGCEEAMVVHGLDGLDEISTIGKTVISHLKETQSRNNGTFSKRFWCTQGLPNARFLEEHQRKTERFSSKF